MKDIEDCIDKYGKAEAIRFLKWCIVNKEAARELFEAEHRMGKEEFEHILHRLENEWLFPAALTLRLTRQSRNVIETILATSLDEIGNIDDDYLVTGICDHLSFIDKYDETEENLQKFKEFWHTSARMSSQVKEYKYRTFLEWKKHEWYEWAYICHNQQPEQDVIEALHRKMDILSIDDPSFLVVRELIRERFYEYVDDELEIKSSILARKEIDEKYRRNENLTEK